ncbi:MAG: UMP kinase [Anaerolineae bacterium]|nr:UMP kinase [Anaerolineae bacterium]
MAQPKYHRILLKLSGEALAGPQNYGIDVEAAHTIAARIAAVRELGIEIAVVIGAGNLWRGRDGMEHGMDRTTADHMGMLAICMNCLALRDALERIGVTTRVQTAIEMRPIAEPYIRLRAIRHLEKGRVVIFGAGTGNPYFTTDTAGMLRALEINANVMVKATKVNGIYSADPFKHPDAQHFAHLTYLEALNMGVQVMDSTALTMGMENHLPIIVLNLWQPGDLERALLGEAVGTTVSDNSDA